MNDDNNDDYSKTVPNIRSSPPKEDITDWGKTIYGKNAAEYSEQPDFGQTQPNIRPGELPPPSNQPSENEQDYGATMPYFRLPENQEAREQKAKLEAEKSLIEEQKEESKRKGFPLWLLATLGLLLIFLFAVAVLAGVYFIFLNKKGFDVTVKGVPNGSEILIDGKRWNLTSPDGSYKLNGLEAGRKRIIKITNPNFTCEDMEVFAKDGEILEDLVARCKQNTVTPPPNNECLNIKNGEFDKAERCANIALDNLPSPFTAEDLAKALNIYIINFGSGRFDIPQRNMKFLTRAASYIQKLPPSTILEIGGHTDNRGGIAKNQPLSENRAKAVKEALIKLGVRAEALQTKGYGDTVPKTSNDTEDGRFLNRRIQYTVVAK